MCVCIGEIWGILSGCEHLTSIWKGSVAYFAPGSGVARAHAASQEGVSVGLQPCIQLFFQAARLLAAPIKAFPFILKPQGFHLLEIQLQAKEPILAGKAWFKEPLVLRLPTWIWYLIPHRSFLK